MLCVGILLGFLLLVLQVWDRGVRLSFQATHSQVVVPRLI